MIRVSKNPESEIELRQCLRARPRPEPDELHKYLEENHPLYTGLSSAAVSRIKGAVLLALAQNILPDKCLPYFLEELETPHNAYLTAVSAYGIRVAAQPSHTLVEPLLTALAFIRVQDDVIRLSEYGGQGRTGPTTTATLEIIMTLGWLGGYAKSALMPLQDFREQYAAPGHLDELDAAINRIGSSTTGTVEPGACSGTNTCCSAVNLGVDNQVDFESVLRSRFEDENSIELSYSEAFLGCPTIVVFFYTRCENSLKCPVTISKLGEVQRILQRQSLEGKINTAAITYDPDYDLPVRLEQYRRSWGAEKGPGFRMLRAIENFEIVKSYFNLGVSYGTSTVNRHRTEAFILDKNGRIFDSHSRIQWQEQDILNRCIQLL